MGLGFLNELLGLGPGSSCDARIVTACAGASSDTSQVGNEGMEALGATGFTA